MAGASLSHIRREHDADMAFSVPVSTGHVDPADRLRRARSTVIAGLADPATGEPQPVRSPTPIRTLPSSVAAVVAARDRAGLSPVGTFFPRQPVQRRVAVPAGMLAAAALVVSVGALATDHTAVLLIALVALAVLTAVVVATVHWAHADPLRIGPAQRSNVEAASRWTPGRSRTEPGPPRALVATAATAAGRVVSSPAWASGILARGGVVVPLAAELDLIEQRAARSQHEDWARLVTRVAALVAYADTVGSLDVSVDEPAAADIETLAFLLSAAIYNVG